MPKKFKVSFNLTMGSATDEALAVRMVTKLLSESGFPVYDDPAVTDQFGITNITAKDVTPGLIRKGDTVKILTGRVHGGKQAKVTYVGKFSSGIPYYNLKTTDGKPVASVHEERLEKVNVISEHITRMVGGVPRTA